MLLVKNLPTKARDAGSIPGLGRSAGGGIGNPLQYACLENPMDRGAWWATVHGVTKNQTQLSMHVHTHTRKDIAFVPAKQMLCQILVSLYIYPFPKLSFP